MLSLKNKKQNGVVFALALFLFSSGVFFFDPAVARADWFWNFPANAAAAAGDAVSNVFKGLLYGIFLSIGLLTSVAVIIFEWAINPDYISGPSGLLNSSSVYDMWKFVRDFFNLFFILTLLYTAFTIVFQVAKDYKKTLLSLVLAALFVNFSFPITRVLIDVTNVPMYYFINQIGAGKDASEGKLGSMLSASQLKGILVPGAENGGTATMSQVTVSRLLLAIIFIFMFTVSLLVLAVMFVVRLVALVMLLIFSSVGFAASVIPGMQKYGEDWWNYLSKYALFGPAAALMLFVSTRFFQEIAKNDTKTQFLQSGVGNAVQSDVDFIASMAMFVLPIIMLWMAIGMASSMSIVGAGAVVGMGQSFIKKTGRGIGRYSYNNPLTRGLGAGAKDRFQGTAVGRWLKSPSSVEAGTKGWAKKTSLNPVPGWRESGKGRAGARTELQKLKDKQIYEQIGKDKDNKLSRTDALKRLDSTDDIMRISAATSLANMDNGIQSMNDLSKALDALKYTDPATGSVVMNPAYAEKAVEIISKTDKSIIADTAQKTGLENLNTVIGSLGKNEKAISDLVAKLDDSAFSGSGAHFGAAHAALEAVKPGMGAALEAKAKKEGQAAVLVDYEIGKAKANGPLTPQQESAIVADVLSKMKANEVANQESLFTTSPYSQAAIFEVQSLQNQGQGGMQRYLEIKKQAKGNISAIL